MKNFMDGSKLIAAALLAMTMSGCVARESAPSRTMLEAEAIKQMSVDFGYVSPQAASSKVRSQAPASTSGLLSMYSDSLLAQGPERDVPDIAKDKNWFVEPGLIQAIECEHCKALGNIVSSEYGRRKDPKRRGMQIHHGIDIRAPKGSAALAFRGGIVTRASRFSSYGLTVEIKQYDGFLARYAHLNKIMVRAGDMVAAGVQIGEVGTTGRTTGSHLHFELIKGGDSVDPQIFLTRVEQLVRCLKTGQIADKK